MFNFIFLRCITGAIETHNFRNLGPQFSIALFMKYSYTLLLTSGFRRR